MRNNQSNQLNGEISLKLWDKLLKMPSHNQLRKKLEDQLQNQLWGSTGHRLWKQLHDELIHEK